LVTYYEQLRISMTPSRDEVLTLALELSEADRFEVAMRLFESLPDDMPGLAMDDPDLIEELDRRCREDTESIPLEDLWR
jgi:hypothetical protein